MPTKSIDDQVMDVMDADPDIAAARSVSPGIVKDAPTGKRSTGPAGARGKGKERAAPPSVVDQEIERERHAAADRFTEIARKQIEKEDANELREEQLKPAPVRKRGAMLDEDDEVGAEGEELETEQVRDGSGKFTGKTRTKIKEQQADADEGEEADAGEEQPEDGMTHEKALAILRLEKFTSKALAKMSPEDAIQLARERAPLRADVDAKLAELARFKKGVPAADAKSDDKGTPKQQQPATGEGTTSFDWKKVSTRLSELYDEDVVRGLEEPITGIAKWTESLIAAKVAELEPLFNTVARLEVQLARHQLGRVYPRLVEDESFFGDVMEQARKSDREAYGNDLHALLEDAHNVVLARESKGKPAPAAREARRKAQPTTSTRRAASFDKPVSRHDAFGQIAVLFEEGRGEEARELAAMTD